MNCARCCCKGCEPDRGGVVGLDQSYGPCSYQLVNILAWDCLIELVEGPEGQRGWVPPTSYLKYTRADDRHSLDLSANGK